MKVLTLPVVICSLFCGLAQARLETRECGTHAGSEQQEAFLHRQAMRQRGAGPQRRSVNLTIRADQGDLALLDGVDGVISRRNPFTLQDRTIAFVPAANGYQLSTGAGSYDSVAAANGSRLDGLGDDDSRYIDLPFLFPFYGARYKQVSINSDGNLTFGSADNASTDRSLGRLTSGPPRIAALFRDLDPTQSANGVRLLAEPGRVVVSWSAVPEFADSGTPAVLTFQVRLYADGRIELAYSSATTQSAVVGISPGVLSVPSTLLSFVNTASGSGPYTGAVAELFTNQQEVDIVLAAQNFYASHDDTYDYLVLYNTMGIAPCPPNAVACENTVQRLMNQTGYGDDDAPALAAEFGSHRRLQAVLNMGSLDQYPNDPNAIATVSANPYNTPVKILGHEAGHLFLSYASVRDPNAATNSLAATPMLGRSGVHWAFTFNSEASLLEGNRIEDRGAGVSPRFMTVAAAEGYSPFDQYLMGLRPSDEVPDFFYVSDANQPQSQAPRIGVGISGSRRNVSVQEVIQQHGRRTPDSTVAQRRFRFAFVLVVAPGTTPTAAQLAKLNAFRSSFQSAFAPYAGNRAAAETSLRRSLGLSLFPAAGVVAGATAGATLTLEQPARTDVMVTLRTAAGLLDVLPSLTIPAGAQQFTFSLRGLRPGIDELTVTPADSQYETAFARIQVASAASDLHLIAPARVNNSGVIEIRAADVNNLPYPNVSISAQVSGGAVTPAVAITDSIGIARFRWQLGTGSGQRLTAALAAAPGVNATITATPSVSTPSFIASVVNAASYAEGGAPGGIGTIFGSGLSDATQVTLNSRPVQVFFNNDTQINFLVPSDTPLGTVNVAVTSSVGTTPVYPLTLRSVLPGIFYDAASGYGSVLVNGALTQANGASSGDVLEVYATGLGPLATRARGLMETTGTVTATLNGTPATVLYSGAAPGFPGLYQVNVQVPAGTGAGPQDLTLSLNGTRSNTVKVRLR